MPGQSSAIKVFFDTATSSARCCRRQRGLHRCQASDRQGQVPLRHMPAPTAYGQTQPFAIGIAQQQCPVLRGALQRLRESEAR